MISAPDIGFSLSRASTRALRNPLGTDEVRLLQWRFVLCPRISSLSPPLIGDPNDIGIDINSDITVDNINLCRRYTRRRVYVMKMLDEEIRQTQYGVDEKLSENRLNIYNPSSYR